MQDHTIVPIKDVESGKASREGRFCQLHGERVRYYCETEQKQVCPDCVGLKTCAVEHERATMKEAAKKQASQLEELMTKCKAVNSKIQDAIKDTNQVQQDLKKAKKEANAAIDKAKKDCYATIDAIVKEQKEKIANIVQTRSKTIHTTLSELGTNSKKIQEACDQGAELTQPGKEFEITYMFTSVSKSLQELSKMQSQITAPEKPLSNFKFEPIIPTISSIGQVHE